jgi:hypothetical protein
LERTFFSKKTNAKTRQHYRDFYEKNRKTILKFSILDPENETRFETRLRATQILTSKFTPTQGDNGTKPQQKHRLSRHNH